MPAPRWSPCTTIRRTGGAGRPPRPRPSLRAARASAALDGAPIEPGDEVRSPVVAGAVRAAEESGRLLATWRSAPLQVLARLHVLAAAGLVAGGAARGPSWAGPGRTRGGAAAGAARRAGHRRDVGAGAGAGRGGARRAAGVGRRSRTANGVVARAAARLTRGGDRPRPEGAGGAGGGAPAPCGRVPAGGRAVSPTGRPDGIAAWLRHCCAQWEAGAREGVSIADART